MSDVLERVCADNPVPVGSPPPLEEVWAPVEHERAGAGRPRRTRRLVAGALALAPVVAVLMVALTMVGHRSSRPRADAAPAGGGVLVHYRARTVYRPAAGSGASFAYAVTVADVWVAGAPRHVIETDQFVTRDGRLVGRLRHEIATDGRTIQNFQAGTSDPAGVLDESRAMSQNTPCPHRRLRSKRGRGRPTCRDQAPDSKRRARPHANAQAVRRDHHR